MPNFEILIRRATYHTFSVEAEDEDDAIMKADIEAVNYDGWNDCAAEYAAIDEDGEATQLL